MIKPGVYLLAFILLVPMGIYVAFKLDTHLSKEEQIISSMWWGDDEWLKELIKKGVNPNFETSRNTPSLFTRSLIEFLPEKYKNKLKLDYINKGIVPLSYAVQFDNLKLAKLLIEAGANPNFLDSNGNSPLSYCNYSNNVHVNKYLKKNGANLIQGGVVILINNKVELLIEELAEEK